MLQQLPAQRGEMVKVSAVPMPPNPGDTMERESDDDLALPPSDGDDDAIEGIADESGSDDEETPLDGLFGEASRDDSIGADSAFFDEAEIDLTETSLDEGDDLPAGEHGLGAMDLREETDILSDHDEAGVELDALGDVAEDIFSFDAGEEGPETEEEQLREEDLPALDADLDGDFEDGRVGLVDLVHSSDVGAPDIDNEGFFVSGRAQLGWVRSQLARFGVALDPADIMGADVDGSRVALWNLRGDLWLCDSRLKAPTRLADGGVAGAAFVGTDLVVLRRQRGTLWVLAERAGDECRELMTFEALAETAHAAPSARVIDIAADRREGTLHLSTDRGVWSFRCEDGVF